MKMPTETDLQLLGEMPPCHMMLLGLDMLGLLGQLQLALRHPGNRGASSQHARKLAEAIETRIVEASPGLRDLCAAGWDERFDV